MGKYTVATKKHKTFHLNLPKNHQYHFEKHKKYIFLLIFLTFLGRFQKIIVGLYQKLQRSDIP